jgi:hypothetical protein
MDQFPVTGFATPVGQVVAVLVSHGSVRNDPLQLNPNIEAYSEPAKTILPMMEFILPGEQQDHNAG